MAATPTVGQSWSQILREKVVFITGAAGGIGSAIAETSFLQGARVVVSDVNKIGTEKVIEKILADHPDGADRLLSLQLDTVDEKAIEQAVQLVVDKWNTVDVLVNAAANFTLGFVENVTVEQWSNILNVNVVGYALMVKYVVPWMKKQRSGSIIQFGSISGLIAQPGFVPYSTTKGAVMQMTKNLALDLGPHNIRCNSVAPGCIETPPIIQYATHLGVSMEQFTKDRAVTQCLKRIGTPQEIANLVVFLASDLCPFITGTHLTADGGRTIL